MTGGESVTITGMAKELNVSAMTIYRRMKRAGVDVAELRDDATGELTSEGVAIIGNLFSTTGTTTSTTGSATQPQPAPQPVAEVEAAVLRAKLDAAEDTVARLDAECDWLRQQVDTLTAMLQAEQQQRQRLLMDRQLRRGGLFGWFRRPRDGDE
jgi:FtsZ-binding cell division protein ZapB